MRYIRYTLRETAGGEKIVPVWKIWLHTFGQPTNAAAVIKKDLMAGGTYAGNPARRLGDNKHPDYINNPYPLPCIPEDKIEDIEI